MIVLHTKSKDIFIEPFFSEYGVKAVETERGFCNL